MKAINATLDDLDEVSNAILLAAREVKVILFFGEMGAGKTTLIKNMCKLLKVYDQVSSPTYSLVNEYFSALAEVPVYHFDFYRLKEEEEAMDMGYEEYFYSDGYSMIEWPEKIPSLWPKSFVKVSIAAHEDKREYKIETI
jgi:tRNA threonylcarbamoyladenosine biosynthesis protein TsaE